MKRESFAKKNTGITYDKLFLIIIIIDTLFLPYIRVLNISLSMVLIPIWFMLSFNRIYIDKDMKMFFLFFFFSFISLIYSSINYPLYIYQNIINFLMLIYGFLLYFYLLNNRVNNQIEINNILLSYLFFVFILSLIYFSNPQFYFVIRSFWTMSGEVIEANSLLINRFTGTLSDPNNLATIINTVALFLLSRNISKNTLIIVLFMTGFITVTTLSTTGILLYMVTFILFIIVFIKDFININKLGKKKLFKFLLFTLVFLVMFLFILNRVLTSNLFDAFFTRTSTNSADSRFNIWLNLLNSKNILNYLLIGDGGTIVVNSRSYAPHNGHLHLIYNYGFISYFIFMRIFFALKKMRLKIRNHLFLLPLFIGFTMNVGIIDFRFYTIMVLLVAIYSSSSKVTWSESMNNFSPEILF